MRTLERVPAKHKKASPKAGFKQRTACLRLFRRYISVESIQRQQMTVIVREVGRPLRLRGSAVNSASRSSAAISRCIAAFWGWKSINPYRPTINRRDAETQRVSRGRSASPPVSAWKGDHSQRFSPDWKAGSQAGLLNPRSGSPKGYARVKNNGSEGGDCCRSSVQQVYGVATVMERFCVTNYRQ